jgi:hypothetical protein
MSQESTSTNPKPKKPEPETIHEFEPLSTWTLEFKDFQVFSKMVPRVIKVKNELFLDFREFQSSPNFLGYTKRGVRFILKDLESLKEILSSAERIMTVEAKKN